MNDYISELVQIMTEVQVKMARIKVIKEEMSKLKTTCTQAGSLKPQTAMFLWL
jgi:hypothetical protein